MQRREGVLLDGQLASGLRGQGPGVTATPGLQRAPSPFTALVVGAVCTPGAEVGETRQVTFNILLWTFPLPNTSRSPLLSKPERSLQHRAPLLVPIFPLNF